MTRDEVVTESCALLGLVFFSIGDFTEPCDGFCSKCVNGINTDDTYYRNSGKVLDYVRLAVVEKLKRDGHKIALGFDPETGKEV